MALSFIPFAFPGAPGVRCAFQTRDWGVSEGPYGGGNIAYTVGDDPLRVSANRLDLAASLELAEIAELDQIHGDTLVFDPPASPLERFVEPPPFQRGRPCHGQTGIGLIIKTADCQPVLVAHKEGRHIAAFHIGWRGNRLRFLQSGIAAFCGRYGLDARDLARRARPEPRAAALGIRQLRQGMGPRFRQLVQRPRQDHEPLAADRDQLLEAGLPDEGIFGLDLCTASMPDSFFSYRRDGICGRQANVIWIA